jgi:hypothetical protein
MIACSCGLDLLNEYEFEKHQTTMRKSRRERTKHNPVCVKCRQPIKFKTRARFWISCGRVYSMICVECLDKIKARIENGGYPPGKKR